MPNYWFKHVGICKWNNITAKETNIINSHPTKDGLAAFCHQFESSRARLGFVESFGVVESVLLSPPGEYFNLGKTVVVARL